jgi:hypothetical protein
MPEADDRIISFDKPIKVSKLQEILRDFEARILRLERKEAERKDIKDTRA